MSFDLTNLRGIIEKRQQEVRRLPTKWLGKAVVEWKSSTDSMVLKETRIRKHIFLCDEQAPYGGSDAAPAPVEFFLASLGQCLATMYSFYSALLDISLKNLTITTKGYTNLRGLLGVDDSYPGLLNIEYEARIVSDEAADNVLRLVTEVEKHCPVHNTLQRAIPLLGRIYLNDEHIAESTSTPISGNDSVNKLERLGRTNNVTHPS